MGVQTYGDNRARNSRLWLKVIDVNGRYEVFRRRQHVRKRAEWRPEGFFFFFFFSSTQGPNYGVAAAAASSRPRARRGSYFEDVATRRASREHWQTGPSSSGYNVMGGKQRGQCAQAAWHDTTTRTGRPYGTSRRPTNGNCEKVPRADKPAVAVQESNALFRLRRIPPEISPIGNK